MSDQEAVALVAPVGQDVVSGDLSTQVGALLGDGWRLALVAGHDDIEALRVVYSFLRAGSPARELTVHLPHDDPQLPSLADLSYPAGRFERELQDMYGIVPVGHPQPRRLVLHGHWPPGYHPMRRDAVAATQFAEDVGSYPFVAVEGDGVYEIPVGPIHAGLIEPGHFRFSVVGETILKMKARLWFLHRGVEKLFEGRPAASAVELAEKISGDTSVAHALAFALAVEQADGVPVTAHDQLLRAMLVELERMYNHVNDIGAMINDVGYGIVQSHAQRLREMLLRHNKHLTGHRLLRGAVRVGGLTLAAEPDLVLLRRIAAELGQVVEVALDNHTVLDRLSGTGVLETEQARILNTLGVVARASGLTGDARSDHPVVELADHTGVRRSTGDVLARFEVRVEEVAQSVHLVAQLWDAARRPQDGGRRRDRSGHGLGVVEAWRGTLCHRVETAPDGTLRRVRVIDPSFFNWPALPVALADTIVPDFPLVNKSFNQSYAGNDL